jgi:hypothetical protein
MTTQTATTIQHVMTGATLGGGALEWMSVNSSAVTALAVCVTAITSIALGVWNAKIRTAELRANEDRNRINKRDIISEMVLELRRVGKSELYINDLLSIMRL